MRQSKIYSTYIMANWNNKVLYIGTSSKLTARIFEHKTKFHPNSFTAKYNVTKLIYHADFATAREAIAFEKKLKAWKRQWKVDLIKKDNPKFDDISKDWFDEK